MINVVFGNANVDGVLFLDVGQITVGKTSSLNILNSVVDRTVNGSTGTYIHALNGGALFANGLVVDTNQLFDIAYSSTGYLANAYFTGSTRILLRHCVFTVTNVVVDSEYVNYVAQVTEGANVEFLGLLKVTTPTASGGIRYARGWT